MTACLEQERQNGFDGKSDRVIDAVVNVRATPVFQEIFGMNMRKQ